MSFFKGYIKIRQTAALMKLDLSVNYQKCRLSFYCFLNCIQSLKEFSVSRKVNHPEQGPASSKVSKYQSFNPIINLLAVLQIPNGVSTKLARLVFSYSLILIGLQSELSGR